MSPTSDPSYRGIVNTWDCDENGHMNVQFYWSRFEIADRQFRHRAGLPPIGDASGDRSRHVRYHAELHPAATIGIWSRLALDSDGATVILHEMHDLDRNLVSATAVDRGAVLAGMATDEPLPEAALPRSLAGPPLPRPWLDADGQLAEAMLTCRSMAEPRYCREDGLLSDQGLVGLSVDAAPSSWTMVGLTRRRLDAEGLGRVAIEKRLIVHDRPKAGQLIEIRTRVQGGDRTTMTYGHAYFTDGRADAVATCEVTVLAMDLAKRKAVRLPEDVRLAVEARRIATVSPQSTGNS